MLRVRENSKMREYWGHKIGKSFSQIQSVSGAHTVTKFKFILLAM